MQRRHYRPFSPPAVFAVSSVALSVHSVPSLLWSCTEVRPARSLRAIPSLLWSLHRGATCTFTPCRHSCGRVQRCDLHVHSVTSLVVVYTEVRPARTLRAMPSLLWSCTRRCDLHVHSVPSHLWSCTRRCDLHVHSLTSLLWLCTRRCDLHVHSVTSLLWLCTRRCDLHVHYVLSLLWSCAEVRPARTLRAVTHVVVRRGATCTYTPCRHSCGRAQRCDLHVHSVPSLLRGHSCTQRCHLTVQTACQNKALYTQMPFAANAVVRLATTSPRRLYHRPQYCPQSTLVQVPPSSMLPSAYTRPSVTVLNAALGAHSS